nr:uncharacterized protein LOC127323481 [Lolium perenne]
MKAYVFFRLGDDDLIREEQFVNFASHEDNDTDLPSDDEDNPDEDFGDNEENPTKSRKFVSAREYYCFKVRVRKKLLNIILFGGRLFQQWAVDMYIKIETMRLDWYSKPANQKVLRADLYQGLVDTVVAGESRGDRIGKRIVLPRTFPGGDRDMQRRFLDAMAIVQRWEIPDKEKYHVLHDLVIKHMLHGPCGELKKSCPCMIDGQCRFHYPREFCAATQQGKDSYPIYRRRDNGRGVRIRGADLDNRWVVPYNPFLLMRYNCHINVEACSSIKAVKYLFKYIYKGHDKASFACEQDIINSGGIINEIRQYRDARFVSPPDAMYRIYGYKLFGVSPSVLQLQLHLPNMNPVAFNACENLEDVVARPSSSKSMLTEYFEMNRKFPADTEMVVRRVSEHYWMDCLEIKNGRIEEIRDRKLEDLCMHTLLKEIEAATFQMPCALRRLFATILVFCEATKIRQMWDKHLASMSEDYRLNQSNDATIEQMVLRDIRDMLQSMGKDITSFGLPDLVDTNSSYEAEYREVVEERQVTADKEHLDLLHSLNSEQLTGFNDIMDHVTNKKGQIFFVDGPGGTGKTYLYKSGTAELLKQASLVIWDEVAMTKRQAVETLDRSLQDIMECPLPFGGKVVIFGGDFRQVLPVVTSGTRAQITDATLLRSYLWEKTRKIRLTRNMRAQADPWFSEYLLKIGNGTEETIGDDYVRLPDDIVIRYTEDEKAINTLIENVFPSLHANARSREYMSARAILSTKNEHVDDLNNKMISRFPGKERLYHSFDSTEDDLQNNYTIDFLNSITPNGLPRMF